MITRSPATPVVPPAPAEVRRQGTNLPGMFGALFRGGRYLQRGFEQLDQTGSEDTSKEDL